MGPTLITTLAGVLLGVLQSTLLADIMPLGVVPDIALILLIASAWHYGPMLGEVSGFLIGLCFDSMSLSPLGFHAFLFTIAGYVFGRLQGNIAPGGLMLPIMVVLTGTVLKYGGSFLLALILGLNSRAISYFTLGTAIEIAANIVLAPMIFWLFPVFSKLFAGRRGEFR